MPIKGKRYAIDVKNLALYHGGIAHFFKPLLRAWLEAEQDSHFFLIGPQFDQDFIQGLTNYTHLKIPILRSAPGVIKHSVYDHVFAPAAIRGLNPDLFFTPYYDILFPAKIPSVITVHDLCFIDSPMHYSYGMRQYYLHALKRNVRLAKRILTVSKTSKEKIITHFKLNDDRVRIVYNSFDNPSHQYDNDPPRAETIKAYGLLDCWTLLYPGGLEYRKNIDNLIESLIILSQKIQQPFKLIITGNSDYRSRKRWTTLSNPIPFEIVYTGYIDQQRLVDLYKIANVVLYLSACEGFGRVCLESMATGTPIVCSQLDVFKEVAGDYPHYCDPDNVSQVATVIQQVLSKTSTKAPMYVDAYKLQSNTERFLSAIDI